MRPNTHTSSQSWLVRALPALIFALALSLVDWPDLWAKTNLIPMIDRQVYLESIANYNLRIDYARYDGIVSLITDEYLWHWLLAYSTRTLQVAPETVFYIISLFCLLTFCLVAYSRGSLLALILVANPLVVDLAFSQLRLALAVSLLLGAFLLRRRAIFAALIAIPAIFIHTASLILIGIFGLAIVLKRIRWHSTWAMLVPVLLLIVGIGIGIATGPLRTNLLLMLADRRAAVDASSVISSSLYLSFWAGLLIVVAIGWRRYLPPLDAKIVFVILSIAATSIFSGAYASRFLAAAFPLILLTASRFVGWHRFVFVGAMPAYACIQWLYWLRLM